MYTAKILRRTVDKQIKRVVVDIAYYLDAAVEPTATESHSFALDVTLEQITRYAYNEAKRLEAIDANLASIIEGAALDIASIVDVVPTQVELDKQAWFRDFNRLEQLTKLNSLGALRANMVVELDNLKTLVATDFKKVYIAEM